MDNDNKQIRLCCGNWVYCDGNCSICVSELREVMSYDTITICNNSLYKGE